MKYALYNGKKTHAKFVLSGAIGSDLWYPEFGVKACVGKYRQYWTYIMDEPNIPKSYKNDKETEWHAAWKYAIEDDFCEVVCGDNREHRADILTKKYAIEIQKSPICGFDVLERNEFYLKLTGEKLIWIVNIERAWKGKRVKTSLDKSEKDGRFFIEWEKRWMWVEEMSKTNSTLLYLDFNPMSDKMIYMWTRNGVNFGKWVNKKQFFKNILSNVAKEEFRNNEEDFLLLFRNLQ